MATADITVDATAVWALLDKVKDLNRALNPATNEALDLLLARMQHYPPPPAGSAYVRTFRLQGSWQKQVMAAGNELGRVQSSGVAYNHYVQDRDDQAWMHVGRWQTAQGVAEEEEQRVIAIYDDLLTELFNG